MKNNITAEAIAYRVSAAIAEYEIECGEQVRFHAGRTPDQFVVEYPDGEEYLVTVAKVK